MTVSTSSGVTSVISRSIPSTNINGLLVDKLCRPRIKNVGSASAYRPLPCKVVKPVPYPKSELAIFLALRLLKSSLYTVEIDEVDSSRR